MGQHPVNDLERDFVVEGLRLLPWVFHDCARPDRLVDGAVGIDLHVVDCTTVEGAHGLLRARSEPRYKVGVLAAESSPMPDPTVCGMTRAVLGLQGVALAAVSDDPNNVPLSFCVTAWGGDEGNVRATVERNRPAGTCAIVQVREARWYHRVAGVLLRSRFACLLMGRTPWVHG